MLLKACLNGGRRRREHPRVPVTPEELAADAVAAVAEGAGAIHIHPRAADRRESLAAADVDAAVAAVRAAVDVPVGVTTGAWIVPSVADRLAAMAEWSVLADFASVNMHEDGAVAVAEALLDRDVGVEAGLWTPDAAEAFVGSVLPSRCLRVLIEPLDADFLATVTAIEAVLDRGAAGVPRLLHGLNETAWPVLDVALERGYDTRIGLEDTVHLPEGSVAPDNASLVREAARRLPP